MYRTFCVYYVKQSEKDKCSLFRLCYRNLGEKKKKTEKSGGQNKKNIVSSKYKKKKKRKSNRENQFRSLETLFWVF